MEAQYRANWTLEVLNVKKGEIFTARIDKVKFLEVCGLITRLDSSHKAIKTK